MKQLAATSVLRGQVQDTAQLFTLRVELELQIVVLTNCDLFPAVAKLELKRLRRFLLKAANPRCGLP